MGCAPAISVVICTYNRSRSLQRTLQSLAAMSTLQDLSWEVIIVDNNSADDTREVVETFQEGVSIGIRYAVERKRGSASARNRGLAEASGNIVAFTDDDVIVNTDWLSAISQAFSEHDVACVGGRILPIWETPCPAWLTKRFHGPIALLDYGDRLQYLDTPNLWSANLAFRSWVFDRYGLFNTVIGHKGSKVGGGEETEMLRRLLAGNERILYNPRMLVYHCIPASRLTKRYFMKWHFNNGENRGLIDYQYRNRFGFLLYVFRKCLKLAFACLFASGNKRLAKWFGLCSLAGFVCGRITCPSHRDREL